MLKGHPPRVIYHRVCSVYEEITRPHEIVRGGGCRVAAVPGVPLGSTTHRARSVRMVPAPQMKVGRPKSHSEIHCCGLPPLKRPSFWACTFVFATPPYDWLMWTVGKSSRAFSADGTIPPTQHSNSGNSINQASTVVDRSSTPVS